jgi:hypothetical protein
MRTLRIPLRVVFYKEDGDWIAHCLEFDLCGDGPTQAVALDTLATAIGIQIRQSAKHNNPHNLFSPADGEMFEKFAAGTHVAIGELNLSAEGVVIESTEAREYSEDQPTNELVPVT